MHKYKFIDHVKGYCANRGRDKPPFITTEVIDDMGPDIWNKTKEK